MSFLTFDSESVACFLTDLENGSDDHPESISRILRLGNFGESNPTQQEVSEKMQSDISTFFHEALEGESDLTALEVQLESLLARQSLIFQRRMALRKELSVLGTRGRLSEASGNYEGTEPLSKQPRYYSQDIQPKVSKEHIRVKIDKVPDQVSRPAGSDGHLGEIVCVHTLVGECADPECPYFHPN